VEKLNEITQEIASAMEEQSSGTEQVVKAGERMKEMVHQNTTASMKLAASAQELASQAEALQELVARFQVDGLARPAPTPARASFGQPRRTLALSKAGGAS
jgi:methyl-accepting chemotaxis protein